MLQINAAGFAEAIQSPSPVFIKIFATWCNPCQMLGPIVENVTAKNPGVAFLELDVDNSGDVSERLNITGVPAMVMYRSGVELGRLTGYTNEARIQAFINKYAFQS